MLCRFLSFRQRNERESRRSIDLTVVDETPSLLKIYINLLQFEWALQCVGGSDASSYPSNNSPFSSSPMDATTFSFALFVIMMTPCWLVRRVVVRVLRWPGPGTTREKNHPPATIRRPGHEPASSSPPNPPAPLALPQHPRASFFA